MAIKNVLVTSTQGNVRHILRALPYLDHTIFIKEGLENLEYV